MTIRPDPPVDPPVDFITNMVLIGEGERSAPAMDVESNIDGVIQSRKKKSKEKKDKKKKKKSRRRSSSGNRTDPPPKADGKSMGIVEEVARVLKMYESSDEEENEKTRRSKRRNLHRPRRESSPGSQGLPAPKSHP